MLENTTHDLVQNIAGALTPKEFSTRLKFIALDKTLFEIEIASNGVPDLHQQILDIVSTSVGAATTVLISAK